MCQYKALKKIIKCVDTKFSKNLKKANGAVGRASLARLQMYKDWGCKELNPTPRIYGPNSMPMG
jgi:hypothetical protein